MPGRRIVTAALALLLVMPFSPQNAVAATVKPLEVFSEKILVLEIEHLANEHILASVELRKSVDRLNRQMNIMSAERTQESLKLLARAAEALAAARMSSAALSSYLSTNSARLKNSGHGRFLPLARLNEETEVPYFKALDSFFAIATVFVRYCGDNLEAISSGQKAANTRYDQLYAAYLKAMDGFNNESIYRSQLLVDFGSEYPSLWELMPR